MIDEIFFIFPSTILVLILIKHHIITAISSQYYQVIKIILSDILYSRKKHFLFVIIISFMSINSLLIKIVLVFTLINSLSYNQINLLQKTIFYTIPFTIYNGKAIFYIIGTYLFYLIFNIINI